MRQENHKVFLTLSILMKVIPETRRTHCIRDLPFYYYHCWWTINPRKYPNYCNLL